MQVTIKGIKYAVLSRETAEDVEARGQDRQQKEPEAEEPCAKCGAATPTQCECPPEDVSDSGLVCPRHEDVSADLCAENGCITARSLLDIPRLRAALSEIQLLVNEQAEDDGLWFQAQTAPEAYLQENLRRLHRRIEIFTLTANDGSN